MTPDMEMPATGPNRGDLLIFVSRRRPPAGVPIIVATLAMDRGEDLRVAIDHAKSVDVFDIRVCVELTRTCGVLVLSARGVTLNLAKIPALIAAITRAETKVLELGLIEEAAQ